MKNVLVSACLLGVACRYDGKEKTNKTVIELKENYNLIPVCPEILGGLPTPRDPAEIKGNRVVSKEGVDVTEEYLRGGGETLKIAKLLNIKKAILKENSPSCGWGYIYDGSFEGKLVEGNGITSKILVENGIEVYGESDLDRL